MSTETPSPTEVMDSVWATFGAGDGPKVPDLYFTEDATIKVEGAPHVPFVGSFSGREAQREFFDLGGAQAEKFEVKKYIADGDDVITLGEFRFLVTATGRHYEGAWALHTTIVDGKITGWQMFENSWSVGKSFDE